MRKVALGVGAVVVLAAGAGAWVVATFDPNAHKQALTDWVQQHRERTLSLDGPITLGVWPRLHVRLENVSLSEHRRPDRFAQLGEVDLAVQMLPLLQGRLEVGRVTARSVKLRYVRDAQGRSNIDDLLKPAQPVADEPAGQPLLFDIEGIELADVSVDVDDARSGVQGTASLTRFDSGRLAPRVPVDLQLAGQMALRQPQTLTVGLEGGLNLTTDLEQQRFDGRQLDLKVVLKAQPASGQSAAADLQLALKAAEAGWHGAQGAARAQGVRLEVQGRVGQGAGAIELTPSTVEAAELAFDPQAQSLDIAALVVKLQALQGGQARAVSLDWPKLQVKGQQLQGSPLSARFKVDGPVALEGQLRSGSPSGSFDAVRLPGLTLDFKAAMAGQGGARDVSGQLQGLLSVRPQALTGALDDLNLQARISEPSLQPLQVKARGRVEASAPTQAQWQLQGDINANAFSTQGQARLGGERPHISATARFAQLDLNRLLPAPAASPGGSAAAGHIDQTPVDLSALRAVDGRFDLQAGKLAFRQYRVADANVRADLAGGRLTLHELSGAAWEGRFKAQGQAQAGAGQSVALKAQADGVDVLALLKDVAGQDVLEGRGQVSLDVTTTGATVGALTSALDGQAALVLRDGAVKGINLARSLRETRAKLSGQSDAVQKARETEKTDFTELKGSFQIRKGVAHNDDLSAKSPFLRVSGAGDIDLPRRRIDYTVQATVTGTVKGQDGADIDGLKGLTVPVRLSGPFDALDWKIAWSGVALGSVQNTLKGQLDNKLDKEGRKLEDQLKTKLLGKPAPAASGASTPAPQSLEDQAKDKLKDKFKGLFR